MHTPETIPANHQKGLLLTGLGGLMLSFDIPLIRLAEGDPWSILAVRSALMVAAGFVGWYLIGLFTGKRPAILPGWSGFWVTLFYALCSLTFTIAIYMTPTANLVFILALNTVWTAILSWIFLKERPATSTIVTLAIMLAGLLFIVRDGLSGGHYMGDLIAISSSFFLSCAITISRKVKTDLGLAPLFAGLPAAVLGFAMAGIGGSFVIENPLYIFLNGFVVIPIAFWFLATGPKYISAPEVAMFYLLETILTPVWVWWIYAEEPTLQALIGGSIMVAALVGHSLWQLSQERRTARARRTVPG